MAGFRQLIYLVAAFLLLGLAVFAISGWSSLAGLRRSSEEALKARDIRAATLAREVIAKDSIDVLSPYPLFEFSQRYGFKQILVIDSSAVVLNDTLSDKPSSPGWLKKSLVDEVIGEGKTYYHSSVEAGGVQAVLAPLPGKDGKELLLVFVFGKGAMKESSPWQGLLILLLATSLMLMLSYVFLRSYSRRQRAEPASQVGFVVDTFHDLVTKLKDNERELEVLRRLAEDRAQLVETLSEQILENVPSGVISLDSDGRITRVNSRAERILGLARQSVTGKAHTGVLDAGIVGLMEKNRLLERGEMPYESASGRRLWLGFSITPLLDAAGNDIGQILVFTDLTELKTLQRQAELRQRLSNLGEMAAGVAHELRNPMAVIAGYSKMLSKNAPEPLKPAAQSIEREVQAMDSIINGFLSFASPGALHPARIDLREIFGSITRTLMEDWPAVEVSVELEPEPFLLQADELLIRQALTNLITNALQAMPEGGRLALKAITRGAEAVITVSDTGTGIPEDIREKIFLPFYTTRQDGTGLGLAIVQSILHLHGGSIEAAEGRPSGAVFTITLPLAPRSSTPPL